MHSLEAHVWDNLDSSPTALPPTSKAHFLHDDPNCCTVVACSARPGAHELRKRQTTLKRALTSRLMASGKLQSATQVCNNDAFTFHGAPDLPLSLGEQWMKCKQLSIWRVMVASRRGYDCPMIILWNWIPSSHEHKPRIRPGNVARATGSPPQGQWSPQDLNRSSTPAMPQPVSPGRWPFLQPHSDAHHIYMIIRHVGSCIFLYLFTMRMVFLQAWNIFGTFFGL